MAMNDMTSMDEILVSVYCLSYNHEKYIKNALEGFVNQKTSFRYEVFVHDDASTDRTREIIEEYANRYPDIIRPLFQTENQYSRGIRISSTYIFPRMKGKYIAVCEGDDYWCSVDKLQKQVDVLEANPDISACVHQTLELNCKTGDKRNMCPYSVSQDVNIEDVIQGGGVVFHLSSLMYRRQYLLGQPAFCSSIKDVGDYPLAIYLALKGRIYYINETMSVYRVFSSDFSWTSVNFKENDKLRWLENWKQVITMLKMADEYSNYKYHDEFAKVIVKYEFKIDVESRGKLVLFLPRYQSIRNEHKGIRRVKWMILFFLPSQMAELLRKAKKSWRKSNA
jgi:glycosyltransferase involved in cell wall biosynthesis